MSVQLALNHSFLEGIGDVPPQDAGARIIALQQIRRGFAGVVSFSIPMMVHQMLWQVPVCSRAGAVIGLQQWLRDRVRGPSRAGTDLPLDVLHALLQQVSCGPFLQEQIGPAAADVVAEPDLSRASEHARTLVECLLHYLRVPERSACVVSPIDPTNLIAPFYWDRRDPAGSTLWNLRNASDAHICAERILQNQGRLKSWEDVFGLIEAEHEGHIIFLESARQSARRHNWKDCSPGRLLACLRGLRSFKDARDEGISERESFSRYYASTGIEASNEKGLTMKISRCRRVRTFMLPDGREEVFEPHAKPNEQNHDLAARVYFLWDPGRGDGPSVLYVGHCGDHLPLR